MQNAFKRKLESSGESGTVLEMHAFFWKYKTLE